MRKATKRRVFRKVSDPLNCWFFVASLLFAVGAQSCIAQENTGPVRGLIYYVIEAFDSNRTLLRGTAGSQGVAFERLILAPNTKYQVWLLHAETLRIADVTFTTPGAGQSFRFPNFAFRETGPTDSDGDGLPDIGEFIAGTFPNNPHSDSDEIPDGAEVRQGTDPLNGRAVRTGIIASADTPGTATDISALNDIAVVADGERGISVFNVFNGMNPVAIAQVQTPGNAGAVTISGNWIAVADSSVGLTIVEIGDPPNAVIRHQLPLGAVRGVVAAAEIAYAGMTSGELLAVELPTGTILDRLTIGRAIHDLVLAGDYLYALTDSMLFVVAYLEGELRIESSVASPGLVNTANGRKRLFVGGGIAYAVNTQGFNTIDVSDPFAPRVITSQITGQFGWKHIVANGSGLGVAATSPNQSFDGPHNISTYNLRNPTNNNAFMTEILTPGVARAVSIYNGLAYVADHTAGLQVISYESFDTKGVPPTIVVSTSFAQNRAEEGKLMRVTAAATDDVQVRNVEFYLDGQKLSTDGNFPFEYRFITPLLASGRSSFTLRARASDTGGNFTWSEELSFALVKDATPPVVRRVQPSRAIFVGSVSNLVVTLSEPINPQTLEGNSFALARAGADGKLGTSDDEPVVGGTVSYLEPLNTALMVFSSELSPGWYQAVLRPPLADVAGNRIVAVTNWTFRVFSRQDNDKDGVPDELEPLMALDPTQEDSNGDGILDGLEDFDKDGLPNAGEFVLGTDPTIADTDADGVVDGLEDTDRDGLADGPEFVARTDPFNYDTDADRFTDKDEVDYRSDPLDPASLPIRNFVTTTVPNATTPGYFERNLSVVQTVAVFNSAASEAISRSTLGRPITVQNVPAAVSAAANQNTLSNSKQTAFGKR